MTDQNQPPQLIPELLSLFERFWPDAYSHCECGRGKWRKEAMCWKCDLKRIKKSFFENEVDRKKIIGLEASQRVKDFLLQQNVSERKQIEGYLYCRVDSEFSFVEKQLDNALQRLKKRSPALYHELEFFRRSFLVKAEGEEKQRLDTYRNTVIRIIEGFLKGCEA